MSDDNQKLLPPPSDGVNIVGALHPFRTTTVQCRTEAGQTLAEALGTPRKELHIEVDGKVVPMDKMEEVVLEEGQLVTVRVRPQGGDNGRKVLNTVLKIAVVASAVAISVATFGAGTPLAGAMTATLTVGGNLLVDAIVPPPTIGSDPRGTGPDFQRLGSLTGSRNRLAPDSPVPRVYGKRKMYPPMSAKPYTEIISNVQYLRLLFNVGYGPVQLSNPKIGNTVIGSFDSNNRFTSNGNFKGIRIEVGESPRLFSRDVGEASVTANLDTDGDVVTRTTEPDTDEISVDFVFPQGLYKINSDGDVVQALVEFLIEYRASGTSDPWINAVDADDPEYTLGYDPEIDIARDFGEIHFDSGSSEERFKVTGDEPETLRNGFKFKPETAGQYDVRITRRISSGEGTNEKVFKDCTWSVLRSIHYEEPTDLPDTVQIGMRIRATDQLQGVLDNFSVEVESYLPTYNGTSWQTPTFDSSNGSDSGNGTLSDNPAWVFADILTGNANPDPLAFSRLDADELKTWADFCTAEGFGYNAPIDSRQTILQLLNDVASVGRATFSLKDGVFTTVIDKERTIPRQAFTPRNSANFRGVKKFEDIPHALKVQFINPDANWEKDERIVYDDGYDAGSATKIETMELSGVTSPEQAWKAGRYYLAVLRLRPEVFKITTDIENIVCNRGDMVTIAHDVPLLGSATGRVKSVTTDGNGDIDTITFDEAVVMESGKNYTVRIRSGVDNSQALYPVVEQVGEFYTVTLETPTTDTIQAGDLFMFGEVSKETSEMIITRIESGQDFEAELTLVNHSPAIFDADTGTIPAYNSNITEPVDLDDLEPPAPTIDSVRSDETAITKDVDGTITARMIASFTLAGGFPSAEVEARWRRENVQDGWIGSKIVEASNGKVAMDQVEVGQSYVFQLRTVNGENTSGWTTSNPHTIVGKSGEPSDVQNFTVTLDQTSLRMTWDQIEDTDLNKYEIRKGSDWATGTLIGYVDANNTSISVTTTGSQTYWIKAIDTAGNKSINASSYTIDVPTDYLDDVVRAGGSSTLSDIELNSGDPFIDFIETDLADKNWRLRALGGDFVFEERDDGFNIVGTPVKLQAGAPTDSVIVGPSSVDITSGFNVTGASQFTGSVTVDGAFTVTDAPVDILLNGGDHFIIRKFGSIEFDLDEASGAIGIGNNANPDVGLLVDPLARAVTASLDYDRMKITNSGQVTVPASTTSTHVVSLQIDEPNINLATGASVTEGIVLYIPDVPTEGDENYAIKVDQGLTRLADLEITGTVNYVNEDNLQVEDKTITVNKNGTDASAEGAGLIVERPSGNHSITWGSSRGFLFSDQIETNSFLRFNDDYRHTVEGDTVNGNRSIKVSGQYDALHIMGRVIGWEGSNFHFGGYDGVDHSTHDIIFGATGTYSDGTTPRTIRSIKINLTNDRGFVIGNISGENRLYIDDNSRLSYLNLSDNYGAVKFGQIETDNNNILSAKGVYAKGIANISDGDAVDISWTGTAGLLRSRDWTGANWLPMEYQASSHTFKNGQTVFESLVRLENDIDPEVAYTSNIGSATKKFLSAHIAELRVSTLVSADERVTTGGRFLVGTSTELTSAVGSGDTTIEVKHNNLGSGDIIQLEARGQLEFMSVDSAPSGTGPYTYAVTRNLDGTGANSWEAGDSVFNTGQSGEGFLDLFAINSITQDVSTSGPTIAHMVRTGSAYNAIEERAVSGNLKGYFGIGVDTWGFGAGDPNSEHIIVDPTDGVSIFSGANLAMRINSDVLTIGNLSYTVSTDTLKISNWTVRPNELYTTYGTQGDVFLTPDNTTISGGFSATTPNGLPVIGLFHSHNSATNTRAMAVLGETLDSGWTNAVGFSFVPYKDAPAYFRVDRNVSSGTVTAKIAGWTFTNDRLSSGNLYLINDADFSEWLSVTKGVLAIGGNGSDQYGFYVKDYGVAGNPHAYMRMNADGEPEIGVTHGGGKVQGFANVDGLKFVMQKGTTEYVTFDTITDTYKVSAWNFNENHFYRSNIYIGNSLQTVNQASRILVGHYFNGSVPVVKALGSDSLSFVQMRGADTSSQEIFYAKWQDKDVIRITSDEAIIGDPANPTSVTIYGNLDISTLPKLALESDLTALWRFDENGGSTFLDDSGNGRSVTSFSNLNYVNGVSGSAIEAIGGSSTATAPIEACPTGAEVTVSFWAYTQSQTSNNIIEYKDASGNRLINIHLIYGTAGEGQTYWDVGDATDYDRISKTNVASDKGRWVHWVFWKDANSGEMRIYKDGELWHSGTGHTRTIPDIADNGQLLDDFDGYVDEFRIYQRALTENEIRSLYLNPSGNVSGTISANQLKTGAITSTNWTGDTGVKGSKFDLDNGLLRMRFGSSDIFKFDAGGASALIAGFQFDDGALWSGTKTTSGKSPDGLTITAQGSIHAKNFYIDGAGNINADGGDITVDRVTIKSGSQSVAFTGSHNTSGASATSEMLEIQLDGNARLLQVYQASDTTAPDTPTISKGSFDCEGRTITFNDVEDTGTPSTGVDHYDIYRKIDSGSYSQIDTVNDDGSASFSWTDTFEDCTNGSTFYYKIKAVDGAGNESAFSNEVSGSVVGTKVRNLSATWIIGGTNQISWTDAEYGNPDIDYEIQYSKNGGPWNVWDSNVPATDNSDTHQSGGSSGDYYQYRVRLVNSGPTYELWAYSNPVTIGS